MILVDANLLLYAGIESSRHHRFCRRWLEAALDRYPRVGLPWQSLLAFVRIVTNPRVLSPALDVAAAWDIVEEWLDCEVVWVPQPTELHRPTLGRLLKASHATGNLVSDAHLAALAVEHGLTLFTTDSDFAAFPGLKWQNPLHG